MASALLAGSVNQVSVTLPHAVEVGTTTIPSGNYTISSFEMGGEDYFVVRNSRGAAVTTLAAQQLGASDSVKTEVVFSKEGDVWHFDKLIIGNDGASFRFTNAK